MSQMLCLLYSTAAHKKRGECNYVCGVVPLLRSLLLLLILMQQGPQTGAVILPRFCPHRFSSVQGAQGPALCCLAGGDLRRRAAQLWVGCAGHSRCASISNTLLMLQAVQRPVCFCTLLQAAVGGCWCTDLQMFLQYEVEKWRKESAGLHCWEHSDTNEWCRGWLR